MKYWHEFFKKKAFCWLFGGHLPALDGPLTSGDVPCQTGSWGRFSGRRPTFCWRRIWFAHPQHVSRQSYMLYNVTDLSCVWSWHSCWSTKNEDNNQPTKARMLARTLVGTVGVGPAPQVCSLRAAFVTSAILCEKLTRTFWKTCIHAFFSQRRADKNPVVIFCFAEKDLLSLACTSFSCFFIATDDFLERLSLSRILYFIVTDKRCLLAAVDRNIFLGIVTALVNIFWTCFRTSLTAGLLPRNIYLSTFSDYCDLYNYLKGYFLICDTWRNTFVCSDMSVCLFSVCSPRIWIQIWTWLFLGSSYMPQNSLHSCKSCSVLQPPPHLPLHNSPPRSHLTPGALF